MLSRMRTGRDDDAQIDGDLAADQADAIEQIAALGGIDQPDQPVADFQFHRVEIEEFFDFFRFLLGGFFLFVGGDGFDGFFLLARSASQPSRPQQVAEDDQRELGQAGEHHQADENARRSISALGLANSWLRISSPRLVLLLVRVTIRPAASETMKAGTWLTRPSPMRQLGV